MVPAYSFFLALRYLVSRWVNLLGMFGVAVAVWALIIVIAVFSGFIGEIRAHIRSSTPELLLTALPTESSYDRIAPVLERDLDVLATAPRLRHPAMYYPHGRGGTRVQTTRSLLTRPLAFDYVELLGIDPAREMETTGLRDWLDAVQHRVVGVADPEAPLTVPLEREAGWLRFSGHEMPRGIDGPV